MKSTQLLSIVFSLIMFTGVTAGNTAFAESEEELEEILEYYCIMTDDEKRQMFLDYSGLEQFASRLDVACDIDDYHEYEDELDLIIDVIVETLDLESDDDGIIEDFEDCVKAGNPVIETYPIQCMTEDGVVFFGEDDDDDAYEIYNEIYETDEDDSHNIADRLDEFCKKTNEEKRQIITDHPRLKLFSETLVNYCTLNEDQRAAELDDFVEDHPRMEQDHELREYKDEMHDKISDHMDYKKDMREHLDRYCGMIDEEQKAFVIENDKAEDHVEKMNRYCTLDESDRMNFLEEHKDEYMKHMKDKMHDKMTDKKHMDYDRLCELSESDLAAEITDVAKLDRISDWCEMSTDEREDYKMKHHDKVKDHCDGDDCPMMDEKHEMKEKHHDDDRKHDQKEKFSDKSDRLKAMIMDKHDISDERHDEIRMKFESKHGEDSDKKRTEIKMKYKDHMLKMKFKMSDERKSDVHDRLAEMKAYKAELRVSSELSDEEKQQLREEFIEKAKDMQLAWISPRTQMTAGIDSAEVECREGFNLVMKASNGVAMCLKADTALKMIDRGIVVPAN